MDTKDGKNLFWTTDVNTELPVRLMTSGHGADPPQTLPSLFMETALKYHNFPAMKVERNNKVAQWTWKEYLDGCVNFAKAMHVIGINERKAVNIMGFNSPEWAIAYFGGTFYNCVLSGVYITNGPEACLYQAENSDAELIVVDGIAQLKKYLQNLHKLPQVKALVVYNVDTIPNDVKDPRVYAWSDFMKMAS